eukprot:733598_1
MYLLVYIFLVLTSDCGCVPGHECVSASYDAFCSGSLYQLPTCFQSKRRCYAGNGSTFYDWYDGPDCDPTYGDNKDQEYYCDDKDKYHGECGSYVKFRVYDGCDIGNDSVSWKEEIFAIGCDFDSNGKVVFTECTDTSIYHDSYPRGCDRESTNGTEYHNGCLESGKYLKVQYCKETTPTNNKTSYFSLCSVVIIILFSLFAVCW